MGQTMRALSWMTYGGPEVLEIVSLPVPKPGPEQILVAVEAATVNPADISLRDGSIASLITAQPLIIGGLEFAGRVVAAGEGSRWRPGEQVAAITSVIPGGRGAHCEHVVVDDDAAAAVPQGVSTTEAAVIPMSGLTAQLATNKACAGPGVTVAITGAGGAVGGFSVELAREAGARIFAVAEREYEARLSKMGAHEFVPRGPDAAAQVRRLVPGGVDALIDAAAVGASMMPAVRDGGRIIVVRPFDGRPERGISVDFIMVDAYRLERAKLERLMHLASEGRLTPNVARTLPWAQGAEAHRLLAAGGLGGRVVLDFTT
jgi:NADPH2:quinone reductase